MSEYGAVTPAYVGKMIAENLHLKSQLADSEREVVRLREEVAAYRSPEDGGTVMDWPKVRVPCWNSDCANCTGPPCPCIALGRSREH
jgi:hypothetical protein